LIADSCHRFALFSQVEWYGAGVQIKGPVMANRRICAAMVCLGLVTTACAFNMNTPKIEKNANPSQRYEITLTIPDVPRTFDSVEGTVQYRIGNSEACSPEDPVSNLHRTLDQFQPVTFTRTDEHTYQAAIEMDYYLDANYFGMGVCHWVVKAVVPVMKTNGNPFDLGLDVQGDDIISQKSVDQYFPRTVLSSDNGEHMGFPSISRADIKPGRIDEYFHITLSARKVIL
jgi:hypothetical protein